MDVASVEEIEVSGTSVRLWPGASSPTGIRSVRSALWKDLDA